MSDNSNTVYCNDRKDGHKIHELVEEIDWQRGKINYRCMWCKVLL